MPASWQLVLVRAIINRIQLRVFGGYFCIFLGLNFTSTIPLLALQNDEYIVIEDYTTNVDENDPDRGCFTISDGCGLCSPSIAKLVKEKKTLSFEPSAIQV